ncbi:MAG TPA: tryptophan synthase subunit beta like protein [Candidatus Binatia bacterium]|nr:tryptophan synthase subunit beta like protein [Candidatus Binatia bacterium]
MPFVKRNAQGRITAVHREQDSQDLQYLAPNHPDVVAFHDPAYEKVPEGRGELLKSDLEMIRVYEDLTDILISKRIVVLTDFPPAAQEKLMRRKRLRSSLSPITEALALPEDEQGLP